MLLEAIDRDASIEVAMREGKELAEYSHEQLERLAEAYNELLTVAVEQFHRQIENLKVELDFLADKLGEDCRTGLELMLDELKEYEREIADRTAKVYYIAGYMAGMEV